MLLYSSDLFEKHDTGTHPECVARIQNVNAMLKEKGWDDRCVRPSWMAASLEQCRRNHDSEYLEQLHRWSRENAGRVESDTVVSTGSWDAAMVVALFATPWIDCGPSKTRQRFVRLGLPGIMRSKTRRWASAS